MSKSKDFFEKSNKIQESLRKLSIRQKVSHLGRLREVILANSEAILDRLQKETGKCRSDGLMSEIFPVLDHLHYLEKNAAKILADEKVSTPIALMGKQSRLYYEPLGTVLVISPWNYPFYQCLVPCTAAWIAGNAVIYKPSEHTPLKGLVEDVLKKAGFDNSWIQIAYGDGAFGAELIRERPDKIFFTGSVGTGKRIMAQASERLIPVELELGGKDPMIVFEDVNIKRAAAGAVWGALTNCGQSCTSVERVYVQQKIFEPFKAAVLDEVRRIKQTVDRDGDSDVGEMTVDFQLEVIRKQLDAAKKAGAKLLTGENWDGKSRKLPPIVLEKTEASMEILREETFGPVIPLISFETEEEVIRLANDSDYGLSASVWSKDLKRADRVARAIRTGNVSINNVMLTEGNPALPFGGVRNSGFGRYKGAIGLHTFCNVKSILVDKDSAKIEANWYPYTKKKYQLFTKMMVALFRGGLLGLLRFAIAGVQLESYSQKAFKERKSGS